MIDEITLILVCLSWMGLFIPALIKRENIKQERDQ